MLPHNKPHTTPLRLPPSATIDLTRGVQNESPAERLARDGQFDQASSQKRPSSAVDDALAQDSEVTKRQKTSELIQTPQNAIVDKKCVSPEPQPASDVLPDQVGLSNNKVTISATPLDTEVGTNPAPISAEFSYSAPFAEEKMTSSQSRNGLRSIEDCVYMVYEADAEIPNGYFCGRCL